MMILRGFAAEWVPRPVRPRSSPGITITESDHTILVVIFNAISVLLYSETDIVEGVGCEVEDELRSGGR